MGSLSFLVSDKKKEYCDIGKIIFSDGFKRRLKKAKIEDYRTKILDYLVTDPDDLNGEIEAKDVADAAQKAASWMIEHADWRYINEHDDEMDDIYLAVDDEDAKEYLAEFEDDDDEESNGVYKRTGCIWSDGFDGDDGE